MVGDFPVVGLGASAGGIHALKTFFSHVPANSGMAFVVIVHLSPEHESHLAEVLQVSTPMPVAQVQASVRVEPDRVYVVPPNRSLAMAEGQLHVSSVRRIEERRAPIDIFFRTLAETHRSAAIAVVLSGTGADGSMGLTRIKEQGGICLVQEPAEAEYSEMPRNAIATGLVDQVLPVAELPRAIAAFREHLAALRLPESTDDAPGADEAALREVFASLRAGTGHDLSHYKRPTVRRRISRRMAVHGLTDLTAYTQWLRERPEDQITGQRRAMEVLHYALKPGHFLLLGGSESADAFDDLFGAFDRDAHVYRSRPGASRIGVPRVGQRRAVGMPVEPHEDPQRQVSAPERRLPGEVHRRLLEEYAAPSLLVDADYDIVHLSDRAGRYLRWPGGDPSRSLLNAIHPDLPHDRYAAENTGATEELQAINEELRSSSEELETSKEELQSLNEELRTVNQELKIKIEEQTRINDDIQNLVHATEIGTIFLDRELHIKLFTPALRSIFNVIPADRGRPLADINTALEHPGLHQDLERVMDTLERIERQVRTRDGRWLLMRAHPYRTADGRIDGAVLTFVDITSGKRAEAELQRSEARLRLVLESAADYAIYTMDLEGHVESWNAGAARMFGHTEAEIIGQPAHVLATSEDRARDSDREELRRATERGKALDERWHLRRDGSLVFVSGILSPLLDTQGTTVGYVKVARDLTERKRWEDALQAAHDALETRVVARTADLAAANRSLDIELQDRRHAEQEIRELLKRIVTVQEDERRRIARDLHDHVGQQIVGLGLKLEALRETSGAAAATIIEEARLIINRLDDELDFFTWELRPAALDDFGLVVALGTYVTEWSRTFGVTADFHSTGLDDVRLSFDIDTSLYRIAQEALNNVYKHAHATRAGVMLERRGTQVVLIIEDDGRGFDLSEGGATRRGSGIGLLGIRERAVLAGGRAEVETAPGRGTTIFIQVPIAPAGAAAEDAPHRH